MTLCRAVDDLIVSILDASAGSFRRNTQNETSVIFNHSFHESTDLQLFDSYPVIPLLENRQDRRAIRFPQTQPLAITTHTAILVRLEMLLLARISPLSFLTGMFLLSFLCYEDVYNVHHHYYGKRRASFDVP